jgi:glycerophosphoryl diester phosphodiesterase
MISSTAFSQTQFQKNKVIAHRGAWKAQGLPQNSLASLREAVRLGCEGSEFDVLEKMILDGTIEYINHISVEWHARFFTNKEETELREKLLIEKLNSYSGLVLESWR